MPRKSNKKLQTEEDVKEALRVIRLDLGRVQDRFSLLMNLGAAQQGEYTLAMTQSQTFWSLVFGALQDSVLSGLCRIYDQDQRALTLRTLLGTIQDKPAFLPVPTTPISDAQIQQDLDYVSQEKNVVVKHLMQWRYKLIAHRDTKKVTSGQRISDDFPIKYDDLQALINTGFEILNRYGVTFFRSSMQPRVSGAGDHAWVLDTLRQRAEADEVRSQEIARAHRFSDGDLTS